MHAKQIRCVAMIQQLNIIERMQIERVLGASARKVGGSSRLMPSPVVHIEQSVSAVNDKLGIIFHIV